MKRFLLWFTIAVFACLFGTIITKMWIYLNTPQNTPQFAKLAIAIPEEPLKNSVCVVDAEEYVVLSIAITKIYDRYPLKQFVIKGNTTPIVSNEYASLYKMFSVEAREAITEYEANNRESYQLIEAFKLPTNYHLMAQEEYDTYFKFDENAKFWRGFYEDYPNAYGLVTISRVGFSRDKTKAFLYIETSCGGLCGNGYFVYLKKKHDTWKVQKKQTLWMA